MRNYNSPESNEPIDLDDYESLQDIADATADDDFEELRERGLDKKTMIDD